MMTVLGGEREKARRAVELMKIKRRLLHGSPVSLHSEERELLFTVAFLISFISPFFFGICIRICNL